MERGMGQQYVASVFGRGIAQDIAFDLPIGQVRDSYISTERLAVNQDLINGLRSINGDVVGDTIYSNLSALKILGSYQMSGRLYSFVAVSGDTDIRMYRDTTLIGQSADYPGEYSSGYLYIDGNPNSGELAITDNDQVPIVLDVDDMYAHTVVAGDTKYTTAYDKALYEVNQSINLNQPVFRGLNNVGVGGGVKSGSYAYAYRMVSDNDDQTQWSPPTPFIPVPSNYGQGTQSSYLPGAKTYGEAASLNATKYGIDIAFRIINPNGFDYVEIKRIPNNVGGPVEYTANPEYIRLPTSISETVVTIINFTDINNISWATLDDSNTIGNSIVATARTVRFYDNRLVLGGITYESRIFEDTDVFGATAEAVKKDLGIEGYTDIHNQVYNKSQRLGEKYGYALQVLDSSGSRSFALPAPLLKNFKFPERREVASSVNGDTVTAATVNSDTLDNVLETYEVYEQGSLTKEEARPNNIVNGTTLDLYQPLHPVNREDSDDSDLSTRPCSIVEGTAPGVGTAYNPDAYGNKIAATGLRMTGLDTTKLPSWVSGFSILRTEPAGRVVAQGIGVYALSERTSTGVDKALNKLWVYSPELDPVIGDKPAIFNDIIDNPEDYELQLVSPVGFFNEHYAAAEAGSGAGMAVDFASLATAYYAGGNGINPFDDDTDVGMGDEVGGGTGYVTFGRWRNSNGSFNKGTGITDDFIFDITSARRNSIINSNTGVDMTGRSKYLEVTLGDNVYAYNEILNGSADSATIRPGHEPLYVVNIIKSGANVSDNNTDQFKEIGHHIPLNSIVGYGTGLLDQAVEITSERIADFHYPSDIRAAYTAPDASDEYAYIWVNDQRWLNVTHWLSADIDLIRDALDSATSFTQTSDGGDACETSYGIYTVDIRDGVYFIKFPYDTVLGTDIVPGVEELIQVRYDENKYIDIYLGDTVIGPASFVPIDVKARIGNTSAISTDKLFDMRAALPFSEFQFEDGTYLSPTDVADATPSNRYESGNDLSTDHIRQWLVMFMCESTINLPFVYKDFFPYKNYVMRPMIYDTKLDDETEKEYLADLNIYEQYADDYPEEYLNWNYGGFHFPSGYNFDYNKQHNDIYTELPTGVTEILEYPKRLHWGSKRSAASISRGISLAFPVTNVYDVLLKDAEEINILYSQYSSKGNNLYAVMDKGVVGLLTDKNVLRDGVADELGVILSDGGFIQGEIILDPFVGCPDLRWRGRAEGSIKSSQGIYVPSLIFHGHDDIFMLSSNSVVSIGTNYRDTLVSKIKAIDYYTVLTSTFDHGRNELWTKIGSDIYLFGFSINNWTGRVTDNSLAAMANSGIYDGDRVDRLGISKALTAGLNVLSIAASDDGVDFESDINTIATPDTSVTLAITPAGLAQWEFTDMFINSNVIPSSLVLSTSKSMSDPCTLTSFKNVSGLYRVKLGRTAAGKTLIGNTLYATLNFTTGTSIDLGYVRTGYKKVTGS